MYRLLTTTVALGLFTLLLADGARAQSYFTSCIDRTGSSATVVLQTSANPTIGGAPLAAGDEVAVLTPRGECAGVGVWNNQNLGITVWGQDQFISQGFAAGEALDFQVWDQSAGQLYTAVTVTYESGQYLKDDGLYADRAIFSLASLNAIVAPGAPILSSPADGATGVARDATLSWQSTAGADSYDVQVSTASDFSTTLYDETGLQTTSFALSGLDFETVYHWRVRAVNAGGASAYTSRSFTTIVEAPDTPLLASPADGAQGLATTLRLTWQSVSGADRYRLQVSTAADFASAIVDVSGLTDASYDVSGLQEGTVYYWRVRSSNAGGESPFSGAWSFATRLTQTIALTSGWHFVSGYVAPLDSSLAEVLTSIESQVVLVKNVLGDIYYPSQSIDNIGFWRFREGYQLYLSAPATLSLSGVPVVPGQTPIPLRQGWNLVAYPRTSTLDVATAMAGLGSDLVLVKSSAGNIYLPDYGINTIGSLRPGEGYLLYSAQATSLTYPANGAGKTLAVQGPPAAGVGASAHIIVEGAGHEEGSVLTVWAGSREVARAPVENGRAVLLVVGDDPMTPDVEGPRAGDALTLRKLGVEGAPGDVVMPLVLRDLLAGRTAASIAFAPDAVWVAEMGPTPEELPLVFGLEQNYPNPFNPTTGIAYTIEEAGPVSLEVFNLLGQRVGVLVDQDQPAGRHEVRFDGMGLSNGVYLYRLQHGRQTAVRRMTLLK